MSAFQLVSRLSSRPGWDRPGADGQEGGADALAGRRVGLGAARLQDVGARRALAEVARLGGAEPGDRLWRVGAEDLAQLVERPHVGQPLDAVGVGVQRAAEPAVLGGHLAQRPVERLLRRPPQHGVAGDLPGVDVRAGQQRVVVEHLLEVRDRPGRVGAVAVEAAADLVEDPAAGHRPQREEAHRRLAAGQQQLDDRRRRELRRAAPAAVDAVEAPAQGLDGLVERLRAQRSVGRPQQRAAGQPRRHPRALLADLVAAGAPGVVDGEQHLAPARQPVPRLRREVRPAEERDLLGRGEDVQRPAALAGHRLHGLHVEGVDVGALLAVDLDRHEALVHERGDLRVLEGLALHDVAPVAGRVADRHEQRAVLLARAAQRLLAPRQPVDGVVAVLEEVGRRLPGERVGHGSTLPARPAGPPVGGGLPRVR